MEKDLQKLTLLAAGVISRDGFLGADTRSVEEIIKADGATLCRLGLTADRVAAELGRLVRIAMDSCGLRVKVGEHLTVFCREAMGRIPCPWSDGEWFVKGEVEVSDDRDGRSIRVSPLSVHLIGAHGFFQGQGSKFRLEIEPLARMLDLARV